MKRKYIVTDETGFPAYEIFGQIGREITHFERSDKEEHKMKTHTIEAEFKKTKIGTSVTVKPCSRT